MGLFNIDNIIFQLVTSSFAFLTASLWPYWVLSQAHFTCFVLSFTLGLTPIMSSLPPKDQNLYTLVQQGAIGWLKENFKNRIIFNRYGHKTIHLTKDMYIEFPKALYIHYHTFNTLKIQVEMNVKFGTIWVQTCM